MSNVYEEAVHTLREVGERLAHDVPTSLPSGLTNLIPSNISLPSNLSLPSSLSLPSHLSLPSGLSPAALVPAGVAWPDDLADRVADGRQVLRRNPWLAAVGAAVVVAAVVWLVRRRRAAARRDVSIVDNHTAFDAA